MDKLLLFTAILLILHCGNKSDPNKKVYLPEMKFKRTENPNYSNYFPNSQDTANKSLNESRSYNNLNTSETLPIFDSQSISKSTKNKDKSSGLFSFFFGTTNSKNQKSEEIICSEILEINKIVLNDQKNKLISLKNDKNKLLEETNSLTKKYQRQKTIDQKDNKNLRSEIDRLNKLIKILSSELR